MDQPTAAERAARITTTGCGYANDGAGSGVLLEPGLVLTAAHVIGSAKTIEVETNGMERREAEAIAFDSARDLALVRFPADEASPSQAQVPTFTTSIKGDTGHIIGARSRDRIEFTIAEKTIIDINEVRSTQRSRRSGYVLQASTAPGDSGAGLFNHQGDLTGLLFAVSSDDDSRSWAVAADEIEAFLGDSLVEGRFVCNPERSRLEANG